MRIRSEEGSALAVVLIALMVLLPLTLILSGMVVRWQRQSVQYRDLLGMEFVARAGLEETARRLREGRIDIQADETTTLELTGLGEFSVGVRVGRAQDAVLAMNGEFLGEQDAKDVDLTQTATDPDMRKVRLYRRLEMFVVEVRVSAHPTLEEVKLWSVLVRLDEGELLQAGIQIYRGYFD